MTRSEWDLWLESLPSYDWTLRETSVACGTYGQQLPEGKRWHYDATKNIYLIEDDPDYAATAPFVDDVYNKPDPVDEAAEQARMWELLVQSAGRS